MVIMWKNISEHMNARASVKLTECTVLLGALVFSACSSSSDGNEPVIPTPPEVEQIPIGLIVSTETATRVTDTAFESGDKIGVYVVNCKGSESGILQNSGNHADNVSFTYNGLWNPATPIYWQDKVTPADFYIYYPYTAAVTDVLAHPFSIKADQSTMDNYKASEFLYGTSTHVDPTEEAVVIKAVHLLSCAVIKVVPGNGFTAESLAASTVAVKLNGCKGDASINLRNGSVVAQGNVSAITPLKEETQYRAIVVPQTVLADNFITVTVNGRDFNLKKEFTFASKKRYTFTVTLNKTSNGINVGITDWADDGTDEGGTAE